MSLSVSLSIYAGGRAGQTGGLRQARRISLGVHGRAPGGLAGRYAAGPRRAPSGTGVCVCVQQLVGPVWASAEACVGICRGSCQSAAAHG